MNSQSVLMVGVLSLLAFGTQPAHADSYSTYTTSTEQLAPMTEVRTTTVESAPAVQVVREAPVYIEPANTTTIIKERRHHHHLIKVPFVTVD